MVDLEAGHCWFPIVARLARWIGMIQVLETSKSPVSHIGADERVVLVDVQPAQ